MPKQFDDQWTAKLFKPFIRLVLLIKCNLYFFLEPSYWFLSWIMHIHTHNPCLNIKAKEHCDEKLVTGKMLCSVEDRTAALLLTKVDLYVSWSLWAFTNSDNQRQSVLILKVVKHVSYLYIPWNNKWRTSELYYMSTPKSLDVTFPFFWLRWVTRASRCPHTRVPYSYVYFKWICCESTTPIS